MRHIFYFSCDKHISRNQERRLEEMTDTFNPKTEAEIRIQQQAKPEKINHPVHYNSLPAVCPACGHPIEAIDVVRHRDFNTGNAMKYIWRAGFKYQSGQTPREAALEDLKKAVWYLQDEIQQMEKENAR